MRSSCQISMKLEVSRQFFEKKNRGRDSSVGIATRYGLDGPGAVGARFSAPVQTDQWGPTQPPVQWVPGLSWGGGG
jgi:hypothetical protein